MIIAGIDFSITCPSICVYNDVLPFGFENCIFYFNQQNVSLKELKRREEHTVKNIFSCPRILTNTEEMRYYYLIDWAMLVILENQVEIVSLEDYALGAKGKVFNIAEVTGLLKHYLFLQNIPVYKYPPTYNKKVFSGKGNANKGVMIDTFNQKNHINISNMFGLSEDYTGSPISDIVDSYSLIETYIQSKET
jgi:Holliday junction resolvasome RuvABC endonuclease subunit